MTVMGLGLFGGGKGVTEFLCQHGANVTVTDLRQRDALAPVVNELAHLPVTWVLGEHREEDFLRADLVIPSPAVPRDTKLLQMCRQRGIPLETELNLFFKHTKGRICAVTGTNGKTTTTSLTGHLARRKWPETKVGGNVGRSLLPELNRIRENEWVVVEISSFQLEDLASIERRPDVAVVTNLSPNHLDRHGTYESYVEAKRVILESGGAPNVAILNAEDARVRSWKKTSPRRTIYFGRTHRPLPRADGVWADLSSGFVYWCDRAAGHDASVLFERADLKLPGSFNLLNATAAAAAATVMGVAANVVPEGVRSFKTVEHRLEPCHEVNGVRFVNDSISTNPDSTLAALDALGPHMVLICGGARSGARDFSRLGRRIAQRTRAAVLIGETATEIEAEIPSRRGGPAIHRAANFEEAVAAACSLAAPGDSVVLSPACPSYDMFTNFMQRGDKFRELTQRLAGRS